MFTKSTLAAVFAVTTLTSATAVLKPIADPIHLFPHLLKPRDTAGCKAFDPNSIHSFFWADKSNPASTFIANFTLLTPGEHEDIIALKDIADNLKNITCDHATDTVTINLLSEDCFEAVEDVWEWVNKNSENTFTLVTEAGQCDPDDVRDPYFVTGARFEKDGWKVIFDARKQTWPEVAHSFRLRTSRVLHDHLQEQNGMSEKHNFYDAEMNELFAKAEELQEELSRTNRSGTLDADKMTETRMAFSRVINATANKGFTALEELSERYGHSITTIVGSAKAEYQDLKTIVGQKEYEIMQNSNTDTQAEWSLHEEVLELDQQAAQVLESAFVAIYTALGQSPPNNISARSTALIEERFDFFGRLWDGIKHVGETVINGVANLLGANKPLAIDLESAWTPEIFAADHQTADYGMKFVVGAELKTGGKVITEFEVDVDFDKASKIQAYVNPEGVFGSLSLNVSAGGALKRPLQWEPVHFDIPIPHASFEIPLLIKIGPFASLGLHTSLEELEGNATLGIGAKATISDDAVVLIDMLDANNNKVSGWTPQFESIGPDFSTTMSGHVAAWFSIALKFEASILNGKIGAKAALEAQAPRIDARFNASTFHGALAQNICNTTAQHGINFEADVGLNLNLNAGLIGLPDKIVGGGAPAIKVDILDLSWPLFSTCVEIGGPSEMSRTLIPTITAGMSMNKTETTESLTLSTNTATATQQPYGNGTTASFAGATTTEYGPSLATAVTSAFALYTKHGNNTAPMPTSAPAQPSYEQPAKLHPIASSPSKKPSLFEPIHGGGGNSSADSICSQSSADWAMESVCTTKILTVVECASTMSVVEAGATATVVHTILQPASTVTITQMMYG